LTIDTRHHILPEFFWPATENEHAPGGGLAPLHWSKEASISFMDDAGIEVAAVSPSAPGMHPGDSANGRTGAPLLAYSGGFIGIRRLLQAILYSAKLSILGGNASRLFPRRFRPSRNVI
jgi:hypothetical protein